MQSNPGRIMAVFILISCSLGPATAIAAQRVDCSPLGMGPKALREQEAAEFTGLAAAELSIFLMDLLPCIESTDPFYRDAVGFGGTQRILRQRAQEIGDLRAALEPLLAALLARLEAGWPDPDGVVRPFSALLLAEVVRVDRVSPWMSAQERLAVVTAASDYLSGVRDYRAFENGVGFRHGVAHGADVALQLSLNPQIAADDLVPLVTAVESQVAASGQVAYTAGEPGRLARAALYMMPRSADSPALADALKQLIATASSPEPMGQWEAAFQSEEGLRRRHNQRAFLEALYAQLADYRQEDWATSYVSEVRMALEIVP